MRQLKRILRALLIRLVFIAYSLMCIWRVTYISDNKLYWLMMVGVGFLLVETGILLWLRGGKEFRGILPSVLFFLSCVVPSIWIMNIDEANRRSRFHETAEHQEGKIKDFVMSLDIVSTLASSPSTSSAATVDPHNTVAAAALHFLVKNVTKSTMHKTPATKLKKEKLDGETIECCDVKIDYWFQEDAWQQLFGPLLLIILVTSRWLITRSGLTTNQRSLILVISVATAADTLNFFCYLNLELVYRNKYLLYSALLIISLSLLQFVFLHVEESLNTNGCNSSSSNYNQSSSQLDDANIDEYRDNTMMNTSNKYPLFFKKYQYIKQQIQPFYGGSTNPNNPNGQKNSSCCCCFEQQDPLFFILLAGLFLHDGSYLTFRIFIVSKLGWTQTNDLDPTFTFFLIKNIFIILTQVYKVYCVTRDRKKRRFYDEYRNLMLTTQNQPTTSNPYRFAQLYADVGTPLGSKAPQFKSMSTLGSNQIYFENSPNLYKPALPPALFSQHMQPQSHSVVPPHQQLHHHQQQQQQQQTPSITESVLAVMAQDYSVHRQLQNNDGLSYYYNPAQTPAYTTPSNPFSAKVGKALYGLPFMSRSKCSLNTTNFLAGNYPNPVSPGGGIHARSPFQGAHTVNPMSAGAGSKLLKSSKI